MSQIYPIVNQKCIKNLHVNLMVIIKRLLHFGSYFQSHNELKCKNGSNCSVFHSQQDFIKRDTKNIVGYGYLTVKPCFQTKLDETEQH